MKIFNIKMNPSQDDFNQQLRLRIRSCKKKIFGRIFSVFPTLIVFATLVKHYKDIIAFISALSHKKVDKERLKLASNMQVEVLRVAKNLNIEQAVLAQQLDTERSKIALGLSLEQLEVVKACNVMALEQYLSSTIDNQGSEILEPESFMSLDLSQYPSYDSVKPVKILFFADDKHPANTVQDYVMAFKQYSRHHITIWNPLNTSERDFNLNIHDYDVILIHYSVCVLYEYFLPKYLLERIHNFQGLKVQIIQDEFRWINRMVHRIEKLGIHVMISSLNPENIKKVYHYSGLRSVKKYHSLPGYVSTSLLNYEAVPVRDRKKHVTYRGRTLHFSLGSVSQEKSNIEAQFKKAALHHDLKIDIGAQEQQRVYGKEWLELICSSKAVLGVEGGASIFDFDEMITFQVNKYLASYPNASFESIYQEILKPFDENIIHRTITPRIFEAVCLRTALILYPGDYSGILIPWEHYIPFEKDGSNAEEVMQLLKDDEFLTALVERSYKEIALNSELQFKKFIEKVDVIIARELNNIALGN